MQSVSDALSKATGDIELRIEILNQAQEHLRLAQSKVQSADANAHYDGDKYKELSDRNATIAGLHVQIANALMNFGTQVEALSLELHDIPKAEAE
ncbi:hypothetical protein ACH41E_34525 [Streptomyces sp. NPDC020412]|uniref:hypothetical protein n=1 Tax=Streptomyces sp. NPDC020412 TaxID=3365073 RepID=UPI0037A9E69E